MKPEVQSFFDPASHTFTHVVHAGPGSACAVIDSVLHFDMATGRIDTHGLDVVASYIRRLSLKLEWILETHAHADHLTGAQFLKQALGGKTAIGQNIRVVEEMFAHLYHMENEGHGKGLSYDALWSEGDRFFIGDIACDVMHVPGHTPACVAYKMGDMVFVGDTMFMPDVGSARCDFPGGNARTLYRSVKRLLNLPEETRILICHDYPPNGRDPHPVTTVQTQRERNIHLRDSIDEDAFVALRTTRDATLAAPALLVPSLQANMRAGHVASAA